MTLTRMSLSLGANGFLAAAVSHSDLAMALGANRGRADRGGPGRPKVVQQLDGVDV